MVQTTAPVEPRRLTHPAAGERDTLAAWSPDGRQIAFVRAHSGAGGTCHVMLMAAAGGEPHPVAPCDGDRMRKFNWHPDGKQLIVGGSISGQGDANSLEVLDLATGTSRKLDYVRGASDIDVAPAYSPDGRWIAFQRNVSRADLWLVSAQGGQPERLTRIESNLYGLAWAPDGRSIVFSGYRDQQPALLRLDVQSRRITELGIANARFPSVALEGPFGRIRDRGNAHFDRIGCAFPPREKKWPRPGAGVPVIGQRVAAVGSPDGRQMVFVSDRTGDVRLWWGEIGRASSLRPIEQFVPFPRHPAAWSPDGRRLLMVGADGDNEALYEITPATGAVRRLALPEGKPTYGAYLPGATGAERLLVVADRGAGRLGLGLYERSGDGLKAVASLDDVSLARFDPAGQRVVFFRNASWGLWQANLSLAQPRLLDDLQSQGGARIIPSAGFYLQSRRLVATERGTWMVGSGGGCNLRWIEIIPAGSRTGPCLDPRGGELSGISYDAGNGLLYYSYSTQDESDIGWARLP